MTIRFAGARARSHSPLRTWRCRSVALCAANDNAAEHGHQTSLVAALQHFARHGLAAAEQAGVSALSAQRDGDPERCRHWLAVCRQLDKRMADRLALRLSGTAV